jgi:hypothetical protein
MISLSAISLCQGLCRWKGEDGKEKVDVVWRRRVEKIWAEKEIERLREVPFWLEPIKYIFLCCLCEGPRPLDLPHFATLPALTTYLPQVLRK